MAAYDRDMNATPTLPIGELLRTWRTRRRLTQMELALDTEISTRHLSFLETGRSRPSREMIERLSDQLDIPLRERNLLHTAAGFAPVHAERPADDASFAHARAAIEAILAGHEPYPALAVDRHWNLMTANRSMAPFFVGLAPALTTPPINVLRATFHPDGLAPRIANIQHWRTQMLSRVYKQIQRTADPVLASLYDELAAYPVPDQTDSMEPDVDHYAGLATELVLRTEYGTLRLIYTTTLFGAPRDVTLSEIAIESFFPADAETAGRLNAMSDLVPTDF